MSQTVEVEPYEEVVEAVYYNTPVGSRPSSPQGSPRRSSPHLFLSNDPIQRNSLFAAPARPALGSTELAISEPWRGSATLAPARGARIEQQSDESSPLTSRSMPTVVHDDVTSAPDRPHPNTWMNAITAKVNALWTAFHQRPPVHDPTPAVVRSDSVDLCPRQTSSLCVEAPSLDKRQLPITSQPTGSRLWRIDSDVAIDLDRPQTGRLSPQLDLTVPPSTRQRRKVRIQADQDSSEAATDNPVDNVDDRRKSRSAARSVAVAKDNTSPRADRRRMTGSEGHSGCDRHSSTSTDRRRRKSKDKSQTNSRYKSSHSRSDRRTRPRRDNGPPSDDDGDDSKDSDRGRRNDRTDRRSPRRRRHDPSPSDDSNDSDDGSSSDRDHLDHRRSAKDLRIKLQKFDGTSSWESWWAHFQNCSTYNKWSRRDKLAFLKGALTGNASQVLWDTDRSVTDSLSKLVDVLKSRYGGERQAEKYKAELQIRRRKPGESLSELHQDIRRLMALAFPKLMADAREEIACDHFTQALGDPNLALKVKERVPKTLDEALRVALQLEAWARNVNQSQDRHDDDRTERSRQKARATKPDGTTANTEQGDRLTKLESQLAKMHEELKKLSAVPKAPVTPPQTSEKPSASHPSQRYGTQASSQAGERPQPPVRSQPPIRSQHPVQSPPPFWPPPGNPPFFVQQSSSNSYHSQPFECWTCGLPGHLSRNCPSKMPNTAGQYCPPQQNDMSSRGSNNMHDQANVYVELKLQGMSVPCLVDSGCELTLVPKELIKRFKTVDVRPSDQRIWAANNTPISIEGEVQLPFVLDGRCLWTTALVSEDVEEVMLGIDWLEQYGCIWDFRTKKLRIDGQPAITLRRRGNIKCRRVLVQDYLEIPPRSQKNVTARVTLLSTHDLEKDIMVDSNLLKPGLYVGRTLLPAAHRNVKVCVANTTNKPQLITPDSCLGHVASVSLPSSQGQTPVLSDNRGCSEPFSADIISSTLEKLPSDLNTAQRGQVADLLREYDQIFSRGTYDMGRTSLVEHTIDTGSYRPIRQTLRRHPRAHLDEIDRQVDELQQSDFIEPAAGPWASNVVLVRKKDGSYRLCVDYRQLNAITYRDSYPLPHIDTCLGSMNGAVWFSTLDLRSGYHNIPIREDDRDKTAFITRRGCFRYKVMPFGLTCAPSVFQRLMDLVLCGLTYVTCLVYLDDIIVFSRDFESHVERLREIFGRLQSANLKLHIKKCCLFQQRVSFLGHVLTKDGIEVQQEKVEAVRDWPTPRSLTEVRSFVGLCSYYRRFISGFADMAAPLHDLTRKNARFRWGPEQDRAFQQLKRRLISAPILGMPKDEGTYYLDTDASDVGLGAVLSQDQDGQEVVLAYASRTLSKQERNYDVTRRELLGIVYGLKAYRQYLLGRQFVIRTDHSALQSLRRTPEPIGQQARWQAFVEQFSFTIRHRPGTQHRNADALSRRPMHDEGSDENDYEFRASAATRPRAVDSPRSEVTEPNEVMSEQSMAKLQLEDPDIAPILRLRLQRSDQPQPEEVLSESEAAKVLWGQWHNLRIREGTLYREWSGKYGHPTVLQLVIPQVKKVEFIRSCHEGMTGGHRAVKSTKDQVQRRGFWFGWRRDVERYCRQCQNCASYHRGRLPRSGPLQPMITGTIMERCHVDITGPHPRTPRGSKYILTCVDAFSKWAEAFAIPNKEAKTVARVLVEQVFCRLGTPLALLTDNAGELDGGLMQEICRLLDIDKQRTSFYHPETNSVAERFHGTLNAMMGRMISETQRDWDLLLPYVMAAYRSSVHRSTGYSPNYLMFAREVKSPADLVYGTFSDPPPKSYDDYSVAMEDRMKQAYGLVRRELGVTAERMKRRYDLRVRPLKFHRGDWVLYFSPRSVQGRQQKWQRKYSPYLVIRELPPVNYLIQRSSRSRPIIAHVDKLKSWATDHPPQSWLKFGDDSPAGDDRGGVAQSAGDDRTGEIAATPPGADVDCGRRKEVGAPSLRPPTTGADVLLRQRDGALATPPFCSLREPSRCGADPVVVNGQSGSNGHTGLAGDGVINYGQLGLAPDDRDGVVAPGMSDVINYGQSGPVGGVQWYADPGVVDDMIMGSGQRQGHINGSVELYPGAINDGVGPGCYISGRDDGQPGRIDGDAIPGLINDGVWPRSYIFGREDGARRPGGTPLGNSDQRRTVPGSSTDRSDWLRPTDNAVVAIAGDPESTRRRRDLPRRAGRIPDRYKDFVMDRFAGRRPVIPFPYEHFNNDAVADAGDSYSVQCRRSCLRRTGRISDWCRNPVMN